MRPSIVITALMIALLALPLTACTSQDVSSGQDAGGQASPPQDGIEVGETAPDFRMKNQDQGTVALSDFKGESNVVLVFYPLAFTPV